MSYRLFVVRQYWANLTS